MVTLKRLSALAFCAAALCAAPAFAQQPARAPAPAAAAASPTPEQLAAAREVVLQSGISKTFNMFLPQLADQTVQSITRTRPELRNDLIEVLKGLVPEFEKRNEQMIDSTARAFAGAMSEEHLKGAAAFFKSEAGRAYVEMQPKVIDQMVVALDAWNRQMSQDLVARAREEMKKKGHTL